MKDLMIVYICVYHDLIFFVVCVFVFARSVFLFFNVVSIICFILLGCEGGIDFSHTVCNVRLKPSKYGYGKAESLGLIYLEDTVQSLVSLYKWYRSDHVPSGNLT